MTEIQKKKVNDWLESNVSQDNQSNKLYKVYQYEDFLIVLGNCTGIVAYPKNNNLYYQWLEEDDGLYQVSENHNQNIYFIDDDKLCLQALDDFINRENIFFIGRRVNYRLPEGVVVQGEIVAMHNDDTFDIRLYGYEEPICNVPASDFIIKKIFFYPFKQEDDNHIKKSFFETRQAIIHQEPVIHTYQMDYLDFDNIVGWGYRLIIIGKQGQEIPITIGMKLNGRVMRREHNLYKMFRCGSIDNLIGLIDNEKY